MKPFNVFRYRGNSDGGVIPDVAVLCEKIQSLYVGSTTQVTASASFNPDGTVTLDGVGHPGAWHTAPAAGLGSSYWAIVTLTSGSVTSGTTGARVSLATGHAWVTTTSGTGTNRTKSAIGTIEIWDAASGGNMVSTGTFEMRAQAQANIPLSDDLPPDRGDDNESTPYQPV